VPYVVDRSRAPLIVVTSQGLITDAEFDVYLAELSDVAATVGRRALLFDATDAARPPASQRQKQAEWIKDHRSSGTVAIAFVITNPIVRGALTAILWLQPMSTPYRVYGRRDDAERWLLEMLDETKLRGRA